MLSRTMTADELSHFFRTNGDHRFFPAHCRAVGVSVIEAKLLKALLLSELDMDNRWVQTHFGLSLAYNLARRGLVENPLGVSGSTHTNLWRLTGEGLQALAAAIRGRT